MYILSMCMYVFRLTVCCVGLAFFVYSVDDASQGWGSLTLLSISWQVFLVLMSFFAGYEYNVLAFIHGSSMFLDGLSCVVAPLHDIYMYILSILLYLYDPCIFLFE